jgi:hypothetical protein
MVSEVLIEVKRWSGVGLPGGFARCLSASWALVAVLRAHGCLGTRSSHRGGQASKSKPCCGGPLAGRMGSR